MSNPEVKFWIETRDANGDWLRTKTEIPEASALDEKLMSENFPESDREKWRVVKVATQVVWPKAPGGKHGQELSA